VLVGFEVVYFARDAPGGWRITGTTTALQDGEPAVVDYEIDVDAAWRTRSARIESRTAHGLCRRLVEGDGEGRWSVDGAAAGHLDGCLDLDLESSAMTNALPVHRLDLSLGDRADAPAVYVHLSGARVDRLDQFYTRVKDVDGYQRFEYEAPAFDFECRMVYDDAGLVLDYPGIATRAH